MQGMLSFPCVREVAAALNVGVRALRRLEPHLGAVAQWSEQGTHNPWVVGSIPTSPTESEFVRREGSERAFSVPSAHGLRSVDGLADDVGMTGVLRGLGHDVQESPPGGPL